MTTAQATEPVLAKSVKDSSTRLLDLLAGWSAFTSTDEENGVADCALSAAEISNLYQEVGAQSIGWDGLSESEQDNAVRRFVLEHIVPLLLRKDVGIAGSTDSQAA